jgi:hypothetical protein
MAAVWAFQRFRRQKMLEQTRVKKTFGSARNVGIHMGPLHITYFILVAMCLSRLPMWACCSAEYLESPITLPFPENPRVLDS